MSEYDVIIVGSGAAGLTAAIALADHCRVLVLAKGELTGGSTAWAQGGIAAVLDALAFREHEHATMIGERDRGGEPGSARADDDDVVGGGFGHSSPLPQAGGAGGGPEFNAARIAINTPSRFDITSALEKRSVQ